MTLIDLAKIEALKHNDAYMYHLWDDIRIDDRINKDSLVTYIMQMCLGEQVRYDDTEAFKLFSDNWFVMNYDIIKELLDTKEYDYNPIENYDRNTEGEENTKSDFNKNSGNTSTNEVSAYNSSVYSPSSKITDNGSSSGKDNGNRKYKERVHGNIGVTTTQQMIEQQRESVQFNIYVWIVKKYKDEMMSCVY